MMFECLDSPFCYVGTMVVGRDELMLDVVFGEIRDEILGAFIVHDVMVNGETTLEKVLMDRGEGTKDVLRVP